MAKTITIPVESGFPSIDVWVNGQKYSYPTGQAVSVPDEVAAVLQANHSALPEPVQEQPFGPFMFTVTVDGSNNATCDKTYEEISEAINNGKDVVGVLDYNGTKITYGEGKHFTTNVQASSMAKTVVATFVFNMGTNLYATTTMHTPGSDVVVDISKYSGTEL